MKKLYAFIFAAILSSFTFANNSDCADKFAHGKPITKGFGKMYFLCNTGYAVLYDDKFKTPLYSAQHLIGSEADIFQERTDDFREDTRLSNGPSLSDYKHEDQYHYHYDRGHMAPAGDMNNPVSMSESFLLTNMIPQYPSNNRGIWQELEKYTRRLSKTRGEIFVFTGPIFENWQPKSYVGKVAVPGFIYKVIFDPKKGFALGFVIPNTEVNTKDYSKFITPLNEIEMYADMNFFPNLTSSQREKLNNSPLSLWY